MKHTFSVLILDGDMASSLAIARSLKKKGASVSMGHSLDGVVSRCSNAVDAYFLYPNPLSETESFLKWLTRLLEVNSFDMIVPVTERTLVPISNNRKEFARYSIAMASKDSLEQVLDKSQTVELAREVGMPVPGSIELKSLEKFADITIDNFPVVIKPARSVGDSKQGRSQLKVSYAFDRDDLEKQITHALNYGPVLIQNYVQGLGLGVEILARNGEILYAFCHQRVHEVPLTGGGSSLRKSIAMDSRLLEVSRKLIGRLKWDGVAMVEFKLNPNTGDFYLMEINGRFWGSLPLAVAAGADFPGMLFDMMVNDKTDFPSGYKEEIYCRRLTSDVHWYELALRKAAPKELNVIPSKKQMLKELLLVFSPRHRFDVQSLSDPVPGILEVYDLAKSYFRRVSDLVSERYFLWKHRQKWRNGEVAQVLNRSTQILFVCYGNINRSALAHLYARSVIGDSQIAIRSVGFHQVGGRQMDPVMHSISSENDLDATSFTSTTLNATDVNAADAIFVMDLVQLDRLIEEYPQVHSYTFLLGGSNASDLSDVAISDPYGKPEQQYRKCFERVCGAVDEICELIESKKI